MKNFGSFAAHIIQYAAGIICAVLCAKMLKNGISFPIYAITTFILICIGFTLSCIVHELGHLIFGLLTGYGFVSYRIGSLILINSNKKLKLLYHRQPGFAGQCLMNPPNGKKIPYVLYNLGGSLSNLIFGGVMIYSAIGLENRIVSSVFGICSIALALSNGIPLHIGNIDNDGMNIVTISKNIECADSFVCQLRVASEQTNGKRLSEMASEWFKMPSNDGIRHSTLVAAHAVNIAEYKLDCGDISGAEEYIVEILKSNALSDIHRIFLKLDLAFCLYISGKTAKACEILSEKSVKQVMSSMKNLPSVIRTRYVASEFSNSGKSEKIYDEFEKAAQNYPYKGEVTSERELMRMADKR